MSRNHHNLYACLYGKQSAYKNASDSRVNSLCDNRRGTWYHVKLLGIGGGPINLVVLYYFFSMSTKTAAQNSLYIILVSQITSIATTLFTKTVPEFEWLWLVLMVAGGIGGGVVGRLINKRIDNKQVEKLFVVLMFVIIGISCYNTWAFMK